MFSLYLTLARILRDKVPALQTIDLDKGQLGNSNDDLEPIFHPGVLISEFDIQWKPLGQQKEQGEGTVTVKTVVRIPARTHETDPLIDLNVEALLIADAVHETVKRTPGITSRTASKAYPVGAFYVVENTYECVTTYGGPNYKVVPVTTQLTTSIHRPTQATA